MNLNSNTEALLLATLQSAASQDPALVKQAEQNLSAWEKEANFYNTIVDFCCNANLEERVRFMAILTLKNGIERRWTNADEEGAIDAEEKAAIRSKLLSGYTDPSNHLAVQFAVTISKIAQIDFPHDWPEFIRFLLARIISPDDLEQKRTLQLLKQVAKDLSSIHNLFEPNIYDAGVNLWQEFTRMYFQNIQANAPLPVCQSNLEKALLVLSILHKLTPKGIELESPLPTAFLKTIFERIKDLLEFRLRIKAAPFDYLPLLDRHEKFVLKHMKILEAVQKSHHLAFNEFAPQTLEMSFNYAFHQGTRLIFEGDQLTMPKFVIICLNLIKGIFRKSNIGCCMMMRMQRDESSLEAVKKEFFTSDRLSFVMDKLLMHYFVLTPAEIAEWESDPENFVKVSDTPLRDPWWDAEMADFWKYSMRSCVETFLVAFISDSTKIVKQQMIGFVQKAQAVHLTPTSELRDILIKDSIYNAVGLAVNFLDEDIDLAAWYNSQLVHELNMEASSFKPLRRRIIWMLGQFAYNLQSAGLLPVIFEACLKLLRPTEDLVVRLEASETIKKILNEFRSQVEEFIEFMEPTFTLLFQLLQESKECHTKLKILRVITTVISKMPTTSAFQAENLLTHLPALWQHGSQAQHNMLRVSIVTSLNKIIEATEKLPDPVMPFVHHVIEMSINLNDPSAFLLDEGLELWLVVIQCTSALNEPILKLGDNLIPIMEKSSANIKTCVMIAQAYTLLCPDLFLKKCSKELVSVCQCHLRDSPTKKIDEGDDEEDEEDEGDDICKLLIMIMNMNAEFTVELLHPVMIDILRNLLVETPYKRSYALVAARYHLINRQALVQILDETRVEDALRKLLRIWLDVMFRVDENADMKLMAIALSSLLTVPNQAIMENSSTIVAKVNETLEYVGWHEASRLLRHEAISQSECKTHDDRLRLMYMRDPIHGIILKDYLQSQLDELKTIVGDENYAKLISTIESLNI